MVPQPTNSQDCKKKQNKTKHCNEVVVKRHINKSKWASHGYSISTPALLSFSFFCAYQTFREKCVCVCVCVISSHARAHYNFLIKGKEGAQRAETLHKLKKKKKERKRGTLFFQPPNSPSFSFFQGSFPQGITTELIKQHTNRA